MRELHAEMLEVKKEVIHVPPPAPPTTPLPIPAVVSVEEDGGDDCDITPMARDDDAFLGVHHGAFEVPDMEAENGETLDDCMAQVKRVKATPRPTFEETCDDIGSGRFTHANWLRLCRLRLCNRTPCLRERWGNSFDLGVQEVSQDSWTVVENEKKSKKKSHFKKDPVFEATSKLNEKKVSLSCFGQVPQGTKMPLFQVPSSSVVDVFPGVNDSAKGDTQHKDQSMFFQSCLEEDPLFAHQVQSLERMLRVRDRLASGALHSGCGNGGGTCAAGASAVEHDSHDVVSECGSGPSVTTTKGCASDCWPGVA